VQGMAQIKVYLDDDLIYRPTPKGWVRALSAPEAIAYLRSANVSEISLDHDLGPEDSGVGCGNDVIVWIEEHVALHGFVPPKILVHTANVSTRPKMLAGIESIKRLYQQAQQLKNIGSKIS